jgi:hypothetical protein
VLAEDDDATEAAMPVEPQADDDEEPAPQSAAPRQGLVASGAQDDTI